MTELPLEECPRCHGNNIKSAKELDKDDFWDQTDTACMDCEKVFNAAGQLKGGFNSDVAKELHESAVNELRDQLRI